MESSSSSTFIVVPHGWQRIVDNGRVAYISPDGMTLRSFDEVLTHLTSPGTCKCGLHCPFLLDEAFNFDPSIIGLPDNLPFTSQPLCKIKPHLNLHKFKRRTTKKSPLKPVTQPNKASLLTTSSKKGSTSIVKTTKPSTKMPSTSQQVVSSKKVPVQTTVSYPVLNLQSLVAHINAVASGAITTSTNIALPLLVNALQASAKQSNAAAIASTSSFPQVFLVPPLSATTPSMSRKKPSVSVVTSPSVNSSTSGSPITPPIHLHVTPPMAPPTTQPIVSTVTPATIVPLSGVAPLSPSLSLAPPMNPPLDPITPPKLPSLSIPSISPISPPLPPTSSQVIPSSSAPPIKLSLIPQPSTLLTAPPISLPLAPPIIPSVAPPTVPPVTAAASIAPPISSTVNPSIIPIISTVTTPIVTTPIAPIISMANISLVIPSISTVATPMSLAPPIMSAPPINPVIPTVAPPIAPKVLTVAPPITSSSISPITMSSLSHLNEVTSPLSSVVSPIVTPVVTPPGTTPHPISPIRAPVQSFATFNLEQFATSIKTVENTNNEQNIDQQNDTSNELMDAAGDINVELKDKSNLNKNNSSEMGIYSVNSYSDCTTDHNIQGSSFVGNNDSNDGADDSTIVATPPNSQQSFTAADSHSELAASSFDISHYAIPNYYYREYNFRKRSCTPLSADDSISSKKSSSEDVPVKKRRKRTRGAAVNNEVRTYNFRKRRSGSEGSNESGFVAKKSKLIESQREKLPPLDFKDQSPDSLFNSPPSTNCSSLADNIITTDNISISSKTPPDVNIKESQLMNDNEHLTIDYFIDEPNEATIDQPNQPTIDQPNESTIDQPNQPTIDRPNESTIDQPNESTIDQPNEPTIDQPNQPIIDEATIDQPNQPTINEPTIDQPNESTIDQPNQPTIDQPNESTIDQPNQPTIDQPNQPTIDQPNQPTIDQPNESTIDQPNKSTIDQPNESTIDQPNQPTIDQPNESTIDQPNESTIDQPNESTIDQPNESTIDQPNQPIIDQPNQPTIDQPNESTIDQPNQPTIDQPNESTIDQPNQPTIDQPNESTIDQPNKSTIDQPNQPTIDQPNEPITNESSDRSICSFKSSTHHIPMKEMKARNTSCSSDSSLEESLIISIPKKYLTTNFTNHTSIECHQLPVYTLGDVIWAKAPMVKSWPGQIISHKDWKPKLSKPPVGQVWVKWFDHSSVSLVPVDNIKDLNEGYKQYTKTRRKIVRSHQAKKLEKAMDEARIALEKRKLTQREKEERQEDKR